MEHSGRAPSVSEHHLKYEVGSEETPVSVDQQQDALCFSHSERHMDEGEDIAITNIQVADVAVGLGRVPAGFHAVVRHSGSEWRTANIPISVNDDVRWDCPIPIPSDPSATLCIEIYASFEFQPMLGDGELLHRLTVTVQQLIERNVDDPPFIFPPNDRDPYIPITVDVKRHECNDPSISRVLDSQFTTTKAQHQLEDATKRGHSALSRYGKYGERRDLERSIEQFERALAICPPNDPCHAPAQSNLAMAIFIHCKLDDSELSLDIPLTLYHNVLAARPAGHLDRPLTLIHLAAVHTMRLEKLGNESDAATAEELLCEALDISSAGSHVKLAATSALQQLSEHGMGQVQTPSLELDSTSGPARDDPLALGAKLLARFKQLGELDDLQRAILLLSASVHSVARHRRPFGISNLGLALVLRFRRLGEPSDLDQGIAKLTNVLNLIPDNSLGKSMCANNLGEALLTRFTQCRELDYLEQAITRFKEAVDHSSDGHPHRLVYLSNLGNTFHARFEHLAAPNDLEQAISRLIGVVELTPDGQPDKPAHLNRLGKALKARFEHVGDMRNLEQAISTLGHAIDLTTNEDPQKPHYLNDLGKSFRARFQRLGEQSDFEQAISCHKIAIELGSNSHPDKANGLNAFGHIFLARFKRLGNPNDLHKAISMQMDAVDHTPDSDPDKSTFLNDIGSTFLVRFEHLREPDDLSQAILNHENAILLSPDGHIRKPNILDDCGYALLQRFKLTQEQDDLEQAISRYKHAIDLTPDSHPNKLIRLHNLGTAFKVRFETLGELNDLEQAISRYRDAVHFTLDGDTDRYIKLVSLGQALVALYNRVGDLDTLEQAITVYGDAVDLIPKSHPDKSSDLSQLGNILFSRFKRLGELGDLNQAIARLRDGVDLTPDGHYNQPTRLDTLSDALLARFGYTRELDDLEHAILGYQHSIDITPQNHASKPRRLSNLGDALSTRFECLGELYDLEQAMARNRAAIDLIPDGRSEKAYSLSCLGYTYRLRFKRFGAISDLQHAISMQEDAVALTPDDHLHRPAYLNSLGNSYGARFVHLRKPSDLEQAMSTHLKVVESTSDYGPPQKATYLTDLANTFLYRFQFLGEQRDLEQAIIKYRVAADLFHDGHSCKPLVLNNLGNACLVRFKRLGDLTDLEQAVSNSNKAVELIHDRHRHKPDTLENLGHALKSRFDRLGELTDLERAISRHSHAVEITTDDHPRKAAFLISLADSLHSRFNSLGKLSDLEQAVSKCMTAVDLTSDDRIYKSIPLINLGDILLTRYKHSKEPKDLEQAITKFRDANDLIPNEDPKKPIYLEHLGGAFGRRFESLGELDDLEQAISAYRDAVDLTPGDHPSKPRRLGYLAATFAVRFEHLKERDSLEKAISLYSQAACASTGPTSIRFLASQKWISCAQLCNHHTLLHAHSVSVGLLPQLAWTGLSLRQRYRELMQGVDIVREAAAAALDSGQPETAVEWLEQGRSIVWGELFQLRSSYEELSAVYPDRARRLQQLSIALEEAGAARERSLPSTSEQIHVAESLEQETSRYRMLAITRDKLLLEIRTLPGFERFLLHKEFSQLRSSAHSGPVVILNAAGGRCDALVVRSDMDHVIHVPLPNITLKRSMGLQNTLKSLLGDRAIRGNQREGKATTRPSISWHFVLSILWKGVVKPVLDVLNLSTPTRELQRVFWCPTGPFAFLPIHAAGLYAAQFSAPGHKISDFIVSSYVPTLGILAQSPKPAVAPSGELRLLAVRQPASDGQVRLPGADVELGYIKAMLQNTPSARTILLESVAGTVEEVLKLIKDSDWVHFACHGVQDTESPTDSGLCLADGRRLKLSDIIGVSRPRGGLAFLSACQTATGDKDLSDEAIHMAAGMLFAGYGGVVGTMWAISDKLAPLVAKDVYDHLFRSEAKPDYREAARALQDAVGRLRDTQDVAFVDWLPFIHVGF